MKANLTLQPFYLFLFSVAFILFTIVGTLTHEYGHIAVAKTLGYETTLHYGSMNWDRSEIYKELNSIYTENQNEIENGLPFQEKEDFEKRIKKLKRDNLYVILGGPIQTMLTGILGLMLLYFRNEKIKRNGLQLFDWFAVFLSLFWLREVFNLVMSVSKGLMGGNYFGGDEAKISRLLEFPVGAVPILLGFLGLIVSLFVVFKVVSKEIRFTFIIGGLIGGISGFILWLRILGPIILP